MAPVVRLRGAVSLLGRFPALAGVDLDVEPGEVVLLRGPNGAGKTTLLRVCAGLLAVTAGEAEVLGVDLVTRPAVGAPPGRPARPRQRPLRRPHRGRERARSGPGPRAPADDDVAGALARLGLDGRLRDLPVTELSAGQRRRTSLAAMVARRPELWLLDEPHAGLDADGRDLLDGLIRDAAAAGATVLLASHEVDRAVALATRVVEVRRATVRRSDGHRAADGRPPTRPDRPGAAPVCRDAGLVAGQGPAHRGPVAGGHQPGRALRRAGPGAVRLRPRPRPGVLDRATAGLFWVAVLLSALLAVQRRSPSRRPTAAATPCGSPASTRPASSWARRPPSPSAPRAGGCCSVGVARALHGRPAAAPGCSPRPALAATVGLAAAGTLYGVLAAGLRVRETLLPLLLLPVVAPVLIGATRAFEAALAGTPGEGWPWCGLLAVFAAIYVAFGLLAFGPLLEEL